MSSFPISISPLLRRIFIRSLSSSAINIYAKQNYLILRKTISRRTFASIPDRNEEIVKNDIGLKDRFKQVWTKYGFLAIGTYAGLYIATLGTLFLSLDLDVFNAATLGFDPEGTVLKVMIYS